MHVSDYNNYIRKYGKVISRIKSIRVVSLTTEIIKNRRAKKDKNNPSTFNIEGLPLNNSHF